MSPKIHLQPSFHLILGHDSVNDELTVGFHDFSCQKYLIQDGKYLNENQSALVLPFQAENGTKRVFWAATYLVEVKY